MHVLHDKAVPYIDDIIAKCSHFPNGEEILMHTAAVCQDLVRFLGVLRSLQGPAGRQACHCIETNVMTHCVIYFVYNFLSAT